MAAIVLMELIAVFCFISLIMASLPPAKFYKSMDADVITTCAHNRPNRVHRELVVLPDADISDVDNDSDENYVGAFSSETDSDVSTTEAMDGEPAPAPAPAATSQKHTFRWRKTSQPIINLPFLNIDNAFPDESQDSIWYFRAFWGEELLEHILQQTLVYSAQEGSTFVTSRNEIEIYLGILIRMGLTGLPRYRMYWSDDFRLSAVADHMSRNRFCDMNRFLHLADNMTIITDRNDPNYDRMSKVRPFLEILRNACLKIPPTQRQSIDEQMIPFKGRSVLRQYLPNKPKKWGFKVFSRNSQDGFTHDFLLYDGKPTVVAKSCGYQPGDIVIKLCETVEKHSNHIIYFDNYFNFLELQLALKSDGIWSVGTIRANRLRGCLLKTEKDLKKEGRGSTDYRVDANSGLSIVRWFDNKVVQLSSTHVSIQPIKDVKRYERSTKEFITVKCPAIIQDYNQHMGGVDLFDMLMAIYRIDHKSTKWYRRIFFWSLSLGLINGWLLYRRHCEYLKVPKRSQIDLLQFASDVSTSLISADKPLAVKKRGRPSSSTDSEEDAVAARPKRQQQQPNVASDIRLDQLGHFPEMVNVSSRQRCKTCKALSQVKCIKCKVSLCLRPDRNCFLIYHT